MTRTYTRDDVQTHYGSDRPAVNIKVHTTLRDSWDAFAREEMPDTRFTLDWIEEHISDERMNEIGWRVCEGEFEYFSTYAVEDDDAIFPRERYGKLTIEQDGRSGGWAVVRGLPEIEAWDAILLARWRKFERVAREIADGIPHQMLASIYINEFDVWSDEQDDLSISNSELPVDQARH